MYLWEGKATYAYWAGHLDFSRRRVEAVVMAPLWSRSEDPSAVSVDPIFTRRRRSTMILGYAPVLFYVLESSVDYGSLEHRSICTLN